MAFPEDFSFRLSGGSGNTFVDKSIGGVASVVFAGRDLFSPATPSLFQVVKDFRCFYIRNDDPSFAVDDLVVYLERELETTTVQIGLGGAVNSTAFLLENVNSVPPGISFSSPTISSPLSVGSLDANGIMPIWLERTMPAATDFYQDGVTITFSGTGCAGGFAPLAFTSGFSIC